MILRFFCGYHLKCKFAWYSLNNEKLIHIKTNSKTKFWNFFNGPILNIFSHSFKISFVQITVLMKILVMNLISLTNFVQHYKHFKILLQFHMVEQLHQKKKKRTSFRSSSLQFHWELKLLHFSRKTTFLISSGKKLFKLCQLCRNIEKKVKKKSSNEKFERKIQAEWAIKHW